MSTAAQALLGTTESLGRIRGRFHDWEGTPVMPTYHGSRRQERLLIVGAALGFGLSGFLLDRYCPARRKFEEKVAKRTELSEEQRRATEVARMQHELPSFPFYLGIQSVILSMWTAV